MCVLSTWFGDICGSRRDFCRFDKRSRSLCFKYYSLWLLMPTPMQYRVLQICSKQKCTGNIGRRHSARHRRIMHCDLRRASLPVPPLFTIMFLDTLCAKKWYDMPHIGCGIHSLQWSTISRIGRHSAGYN